MPLELSIATAIGLYLLLVLLPGLALSRLGPSGGDRFVDLGVAAGAGLAVQPLIYLWARAMGLSLGPGVWWAILVGAGLVVAIRERRGVCHALAGLRGEPAGLAHALARALTSAHGALVLVLALVLASRWWAARELVAPMWGDSVHHTMIVQLFLTSGGLVSNWLPLAPLSTFTYHFGLHASVASLAWLTGLSAAQALLVAGQVLSVLGVLTAYALVAGLSGRSWAGVGAAIAAGGLSTMPAFYLNWGRYTQLAGQVVLPAAALTAVWLAGAPRFPRRQPAPGRPSPRLSGALAAVLAAGLFLTHYLVALFYALFLLVWLVLGSVPAGSTGSRRARLVRLVALAGAAAVLAAPWWPQFAAGPLGRRAVQLSTGRVADAVFGVVPPSYVWSNVDRHLGWTLVVATLVAAGWGLRRREPVVRLGVGWMVLLLLAAYPRYLGLPITGVLKDFTVAIGLYVPAGLVVGGALGEAVAVARSADGQSPAWLWLAVVGLAAALAWGQRDVAVAEHAYVLPADRRAMDWIKQHTPSQAVFLVGARPAFGGTIVVGVDAGWWLPLLAGRRTTVSPATVGTERSLEPDYRQRLNRLVALWQEDLDAPATRAALDELGVTHAYVGVRSRLVPAARVGLDQRLAASPYWELVYDQGGAQVYVRKAIP